MVRHRIGHLICPVFSSHSSQNLEQFRLCTWHLLGVETDLRLHNLLITATDCIRLFSTLNALTALFYDYYYWKENSGIFQTFSSFPTCTLSSTMTFILTLNILECSATSFFSRDLKSSSSFFFFLNPKRRDGPSNYCISLSPSLSLFHCMRAILFSQEFITIWTEILSQWRQ